MPPQKSLIKFKEALIPLFFTLFSIFIVNGYRFGTHDHSIILPFIQHSIDNTLYPGDYLIAQKPYFLTILWDMTAILKKITVLSFEAIFFIGYFLSLFLTFLAIYMLAKKIYDKKCAILACGLFLPNIFTPLGGVDLIEQFFLTRTLALPLTIFAFLYSLEEKHAGAAVLLGLTFLIHPITAMAALIPISIATAIRHKTNPAVLIRPAVIITIFTLPLMIKKMTLHGSMTPFILENKRWFELLSARSAHHIFIQNMDITTLAVFITAIMLFVSCRALVSTKNIYAQTIDTWVKIIFYASMISAIFTQILPIPFIVQLQLLRSTQYFLIITILYLSAALLRAPRVCQTVAAISFITITATLILKRGEFKDFSTANRQEPSWQDVQQWACLNTSKDAYFITPPRLEGFRANSMRSIHGEYKDGTQMFFNINFADEWSKRMNDLTGINKISLKKIAEETKHPVIFAVLEKNNTLEKDNIVYCNKNFTVYKFCFVE